MPSLNSSLARLVAGTSILVVACAGPRASRPVTQGEDQAGVVAKNTPERRGRVKCRANPDARPPDSMEPMPKGALTCDSNLFDEIGAQDHSCRDTGECFSSTWKLSGAADHAELAVLLATMDTTRLSVHSQYLLVGARGAGGWWLWAVEREWTESLAWWLDPASEAMPSPSWKGPMPPGPRQLLTFADRNGWGRLLQRTTWRVACPDNIARLGVRDAERLAQAFTTGCQYTEVDEE